jgi:hypothetical protein
MKNVINEEEAQLLPTVNIPSDTELRLNHRFDLVNEMVVSQDADGNFTAWSTPCADNCPGKKYYPKIHYPHVPLYPPKWA